MRYEKISGYVFSANVLFDLATPFFITEYDLSHMELLRQSTSPASSTAATS